MVVVPKLSGKTKHLLEIKGQPVACIGLLTLSVSLRIFGIEKKRITTKDPINKSKK